MSSCSQDICSELVDMTHGLGESNPLWSSSCSLGVSGAPLCTNRKMVPVPRLPLSLQHWNKTREERAIWTDGRADGDSETILGELVCLCGAAGTGHNNLQTPGSLVCSTPRHLKPWEHFSMTFYPCAASNTILPLGCSWMLPSYVISLLAGGGWTVIQRRQDGSVDFNRTWNEYREGFGDLNGEFWLGNENIHKMTSQGDYSLRIDLEDWNSKHKHAFYQVFSIEDEANYYRLHVDGFSGTVEDSFAWYHNKRSFSTPDTGNICAEISHGGWWYHQCFFSNLNGVYYKVRWRNEGADVNYYSLRKVVMMIRPRTFRPHLSP
uniref:Fibrinogen C-terminal domain-containing protein n=1 Tax=Amazona collaria TaxID=241587 RepID=A0A8B9FGJ3_9PSIT